MYIQTEETPNPNSLKFLPGTYVTSGDVYNFKDISNTNESPLAQELFSINGVSGVYLGHDFITVTKEESHEWVILKPFILSCILDFFMRGGLAVDSKKTTNVNEMKFREEDKHIVDQIIEIIENQVRPAVAADGGDIVFRGFDEGIVLLELHGACSGCPSSSITLKNGIETMLKHYVPEVLGVEAVSGE